MLKMYVDVIETIPEEQVVIQRVEDKGQIIASFNPMLGKIDLSALENRLKETIRVFHNDIFHGDFIIKSVVKTAQDGIHLLDLEPVK